MKARIDAPLTEQDGDILWSVQRRFRNKVGLHIIEHRSLIGHSQHQDRLDAELVFQAQLHPFISGTYTGSGEFVALRSRLTSYRRAGLV